MSAELRGVSLRLILDKFKREKGIWIKGDESALEETVSIRFTDLPVHIGLGRILSHMNHVLVFDNDKGLVGLFILGKKIPGGPVLRDAHIISEKSPSSQSAEEATAGWNPFEIFPGAPTAGNPKRKSPKTATEISDMISTSMSSVPKSPFGENGTSSPENPFAESVNSLSKHPFDENIPPSSENRSADPFGVFIEAESRRGGTRGN